MIREKRQNFLSKVQLIMANESKPLHSCTILQVYNFISLYQLRVCKLPHCFQKAVSEQYEISMALITRSLLYLLTAYMFMESGLFFYASVRSS